MTSASDTCSMDKDTCPDSITARSRISLISFSRCHPAWRIWEIRAAWEAVGNGTADSISCAKPRIALSGLRSSWLMLERKSDLARFAFSATDFELSSSTFVLCRFHQLREAENCIERATELMAHARKKIRFGEICLFRHRLRALELDIRSLQRLLVELPFRDVSGSREHAL